MPVFGDSDIQQLDWLLFRDGPVVLYHRQEVLEADLAWLRGRGYQVDELDCGAWLTPDDMYDGVYAGLGISRRYGHNASALEDALQDLVAPDAAGRVAVFRCIDRFMAAHGDLVWLLAHLLAKHSRLALMEGRRLLALLQSDDPRIALAPVGAATVGWNRREWHARDRGV